MIRSRTIRCLIAASACIALSGTGGSAKSSGSGLQDLGTLGGSCSEVIGVTQSDVMSDLGTLGGSTSAPIAFNESGQIVGISLTSEDAESHAFRWSGGVMTDLGTLGGSTSYPVAINSGGSVIGSSRLSNRDQHAFVYVGNATVDLQTLGGSSSTPISISDAGGIVGDSTLLNVVPGAQDVKLRWTGGTPAFSVYAASDPAAVAPRATCRRSSTLARGPTSGAGFPPVRSDSIWSSRRSADVTIGA